MNVPPKYTLRSAEEIEACILADHPGVTTERKQLLAEHLTATAAVDLERTADVLLADEGSAAEHAFLRQILSLDPAPAS